MLRLALLALLPVACYACAGAKGEGRPGTPQDRASECSQSSGPDTCVERCGCLWTPPPASNASRCTYRPSGNPCCTSVEPWIYPDPSREHLDALLAVGTPLRRNDTIAFFGDSITWLSSYLNRFRDELASGPGTADLGVQLLNFGVNGIKTIGLANGTINVTSSDYIDGRFVKYVYRGFANMLAAADPKPRVAVVQVGINDVWFPGGTGADRAVADAEQYASVLYAQFVRPAAAQGVKLVLASVTVIGEKQAGTNANDKTLDAFQAAMHRVATEGGVPFTDLRAAYTAYESKANGTSQQRHQSTWPHAGILTYDGVHPSEDGDKMLVNQHAGGILAALA
jgi:lysophospholipase L1-like esterase